MIVVCLCFGEGCVLVDVLVITVCFLSARGTGSQWHDARRFSSHERFTHTGKHLNQYFVSRMSAGNRIEVNMYVLLPSYQIINGDARVERAFECYFL